MAKLFDMSRWQASPDNRHSLCEVKKKSSHFQFFRSGLLLLSLRQRIIINSYRSKSKLFCLLVIVFIGSLAHWCIMWPEFIKG
jgi:hypothetical protein